MMILDQPQPAMAGGAPAARPRCPHEPVCPSADRPGREAAIPVALHPDQGWSLLCNGVVVFEDTGELLPDGRVIAPHRVR
jgi:hypothetical protein